MKKTNKQIETEYAKMVQQNNKPVDENRVNCYKCDHCKNVTKTIDVDNGVTPMLIGCDNCGQMAKSTFYTDIVPGQPPTKEWYRPTLEKVMKMHRRGYTNLMDHVLNGGLDIRPVFPKI